MFNYYFDFCLKVCAKELDTALPDGWGLPLKYRVAGECFDRKRDGKMSGADTIRWILYADDLALFCRSVQEAKIVMDTLHRVCTRFGLTISFKKTKSMVFGNESLAESSSLLTVDGHELENVREFCYLGHMLSNHLKN